MSKPEETIQPNDGKEELHVSEDTKTSVSRSRLLYILLIIVVLLLLTIVAVVLGVILSREDIEMPTMAPSTPIEITNSSFTTDTISVTWELVTDQPVSGYKLTIFPPPYSGPDVITTDPETDRATFTDLISGAQHTVTLEATGTAIPKSVIKQYTSPNKPQHLSYDDRQFPDVLILHWFPPKSGNVDMYNVYQSQDRPTTPAPVLIFEVPPIGNLTAHVRWLDHGPYYRFDVKTVVGENKNIMSEPISITYSMS